MGSAFWAFFPAYIMLMAMALGVVGMILRYVWWMWDDN